MVPQGHVCPFGEEQQRNGRALALAPERGIRNRWWNDPILLGRPADIKGYEGMNEWNMQEIHRKLDFVGINAYQPYPNCRNAYSRSCYDDRKTAMGWVIDGRCIYWTLRFFYERYRLPIMVTENGMADTDVPNADGRIHDMKRICFMREYLANLAKAIREGIPVLGYQYWSLMDNFEWLEGYDARFGLIYVDYESKKRYLKDSAYYYKDIIAANGAII